MACTITPAKTATPATTPTTPRKPETVTHEWDMWLMSALVSYQDEAGRAEAEEKVGPTVNHSFFTENPRYAYAEALRFIDPLEDDDCLEAVILRHMHYVETLTLDSTDPDLYDDEFRQEILEEVYITRDADDFIVTDEV